MTRPKKPGDHPEFFRFPAPAGRSRESTIVLNRNGTFSHDGRPIENARMARAFSGWINRHPDDGRFILENGYDWTYFTVEDVPYFVTSVRAAGPEEAPVAMVTLSDGTEEQMSGEKLWIGEQDALYFWVKGGRFSARFTPAAQVGLAPFLRDNGDGRPFMHLGGVDYPIALRAGEDSAKRGS
jgi:hypothetical protein